MMKVHIPVDVRLRRAMEGRKLLSGETLTRMYRNAIAQYLDLNPEDFLDSDTPDMPIPRKGKQEMPLTMEVRIGNRTVLARRTDGLVPYDPRKDGAIRADRRLLLPRLVDVTLLCAKCEKPYQVTVSKKGRVKRLYCDEHMTYTSRAQRA